MDPFADSQFISSAKNPRNEVRTERTRFSEVLFSEEGNLDCRRFGFDRARPSRLVNDGKDK